MVMHVSSDSAPSYGHSGAQAEGVDPICPFRSPGRQKRGWGRKQLEKTRPRSGREMILSQDGRPHREKSKSMKDESS